MGHTLTMSTRGMCNQFKQFIFFIEFIIITATTAICPYPELEVTSNPDEGIFTPGFGGGVPDSKNASDILRDSGVNEGVELCTGNYILFKENCEGGARIMLITLEVQEVANVTFVLLGSSDEELDSMNVC